MVLYRSAAVSGGCRSGHRGIRRPLRAGGTAGVTHNFKAYL